MYGYFKDLKCLAEDLIYDGGNIDEIDMGTWGADSKRIRFTGTTNKGEPFELTLEITNKEAAKDGT